MSPVTPSLLIVLSFVLLLLGICSAANTNNSSTSTTPSSSPDVQRKNIKLCFLYSGIVSEVGATYGLNSAKIAAMERLANVSSINAVYSLHSFVTEGLYDHWDDEAAMRGIVLERITFGCHAIVSPLEVEHKKLWFNLAQQFSNITFHFVLGSHLPRVPNAPTNTYFLYDQSQNALYNAGVVAAHRINSLQLTNATCVGFLSKDMHDYSLVNAFALGLQQHFVGVNVTVNQIALGTRHRWSDGQKLIVEYFSAIQCPVAVLVDPEYNAAYTVKEVGDPNMHFISSHWLASVIGRVESLGSIERGLETAMFRALYHDLISRMANTASVGSVYGTYSVFHTSLFTMLETDVETLWNDYNMEAVDNTFVFCKYGFVDVHGVRYTPPSPCIPATTLELITSPIAGVARLESLSLRNSCPPGHVFLRLDTGCVPCPANTYPSGENIYTMECLPCPEGRSAEVGSATCTSPSDDFSIVVIFVIALVGLLVIIAISIGASYGYDAFVAYKLARRAPRKNPVVVLSTEIDRAAELWSAVPNDMGRSMQQHHKMLRRLLQEHEGHEIKDNGDGLLCVFSEPTKAVTFAMETQKQLLTLEYPIDLVAHDAACIIMDAASNIVCRGFRIRIGVDYGDVDMVFPDKYLVEYSGTLLERVETLQKMACGGQTLLTDTLHDAMIENLNDMPVLVRMRYEGRHAIDDSGKRDVYSMLPLSLEDRQFSQISSSQPAAAAIPASSASGDFTDGGRNALDEYELLERVRRVFPPKGIAVDDMCMAMCDGLCNAEKGQCGDLSNAALHAVLEIVKLADNRQITTGSLLSSFGNLNTDQQKVVWRHVTNMLVCVQHSSTRIRILTNLFTACTMKYADGKRSSDK
eukprot:PhM_4_TR4067/c0_g3_i1/m.30650